jgi:hypothetical protein
MVAGICRRNKKEKWLERFLRPTPTAQPGGKCDPTCYVGVHFHVFREPTVTVNG